MKKYIPTTEEAINIANFTKERVSTHLMSNDKAVRKVQSICNILISIIETESQKERTQ